MAGEPAVADGEVSRERVVGRHRGGGVVAHDLGRLLGPVLFGPAPYEPVHQAAVDRAVRRLVAVGRVR